MQNKRSIIIILAFVIGVFATIIIKTDLFSQNQSTLHMVDTKSLSSMIDNNEDMVIVDLREPELFTAARIPGTQNIPFADISTRFKELPTNKKIVFVCHTGRMGTESGNLLLENGYKKVYNLEGGMARWTGKLID